MLVRYREHHMIPFAGHDGIVGKLAREAASATAVEDVPCPDPATCWINIPTGQVGAKFLVASDEIGVWKLTGSSDVGWIQNSTDQGPVTGLSSNA